ncbi:MAG: hypothetical protein JSR26_06445 [Proteobacteria bacterium]|nr:hypothetical protein [Pseudomonadota bacterium]
MPARESGDLSLQRIRVVLQVFLRALLIRLDDVGTQDDFFATAMADLDADVRDDLHAVLRRSHIDCTDATLHPALLIGLAAALGETLPQAVIDLLEAAWQAGAAGARGVSLSKTAEVCELAFARALRKGETASRMTRLLRVFGMG